jgi:hypothetical protein
MTAGRVEMVLQHLEAAHAFEPAPSSNQPQPTGVRLITE